MYDASEAKKELTLKKDSVSLLEKFKMSDKATKEYLERQFTCFQMQAMRAHAEIVSGAYKLVDCSHFVNDKWVQKSDEEKLKDKIEEMRRHIRFLHDQNEALYNLQKED